MPGAHLASLSKRHALNLFHLLVSLKENGSMNAFDFSIVVANFAFLGNSTGSAIGALRMLRLVRLLTFIKGVPQLRVIIAGLIQVDVAANTSHCLFVVLSLLSTLHTSNINSCTHIIFRIESHRTYIIIIIT